MTFLNTIGQNFVGAIVALALVLTPAFAFAENNGSGKNKSDKDDDFKFRSSIVEKIRNAGTAVEVQMHQNGRALVRGASVSDVSGSTITAKTAFGSTTLTWTINTNSNTEFVAKRGQGSLANIAVGDIISASGVLNLGASSLTMDAKVVKDWTNGDTPNPSPVQDIFQGSLREVASTTLPTTLTLRINGTDYTVDVSSSTQILKANWSSATIDYFEVGDTVRVYGSLSGTTITALVVRNASR